MKIPILPSRRRLAVLLLVTTFLSSCTGAPQPIRYGISPYQDTALPIVADKNGWYAQAGLNVRVVLVDWANVMNSVASGSVDLAVMNFNTFQAAYANINDRGGDVLFYYPLYVFKGSAIMVRSSSGLKTVDAIVKQGHLDRNTAILHALSQLKGKTIITTPGTEMSQIVIAGLSKAGLRPGVDAKIVNAQPADGLRAFLAGDGDAYSGGLTERTEAQRHGAVELISSADLLPPVIDGLVTTKRFAAAHAAELDKIARLWFKTIGWMESDLPKRSAVVIDYLSAKGSTHYSADEYVYAWRHAEVFPSSVTDIQKTILSANALYFWRRSWDANNVFLLQQKKISSPVPYGAFSGDAVQARLASHVAD